MPLPIGGLIGGVMQHILRLLRRAEKTTEECQVAEAFAVNNGVLAVSQS